MKIYLCALALIAAAASGQTPVIGGSSANVNGTAITPSLVTVNNQALTPASPLQPFIAGAWESKRIIATGDSTTALSQGSLSSLCLRNGPAQEMAGILCVYPSTYSIDGSHNVTVVMATTLPANCSTGKYISFDSSSTFQSNALNNANGSNSTFLIASTPATNSVTFSNPSSAGSTGSTAANGVATCSIVNNGSNGSTQAAYNVASGLGGAGLITTLQPDLDMHSMGINDVRGGAVSAAQLAVLYKAYIDTIRVNSTKTSILFYTPNSLLADDPGSAGLVTSPSTTSTTAVVGTGTCTITPAVMLNSISGLVTPDLTLAQEVANGSASLVIDSGGSLETVPILAIDLVNGTVTATCANTHSSGFAVVPNLATMAQSYTNILHDATMSFEGVYPNVQVVDTQVSAFFGRLVPLSTQTSLMANQLHPSLNGYSKRATFLSAVLTKDRHSSGSHGTGNPNAGVPNAHYASVVGANQIQAINAISNSYSACWTNGYYQCVENPDYYTLIGSGGLVAYGSASFVRITAEANALGSASTFGVLPILSGDVIEIVGYGNAIASGAGTLFSTYTQVLTASTIAANIPLQTAVRVYRAKFKSAAQELYAKSTGVYTYHHTVNINAGGTNFFRFSYTDATYTWGGYYTTADVILLSDGTTQALTGCAFTQFSTYVQCAVSGSFAGIAGLNGDIYGTHAQEGTFSIPAAPTSYTLGTNVTSCVCATGSNCTTAAGSLTIVGGTATTGTICSPVWTATPAALKCGAWQNGGASSFGIGNAAASTTGFAISAGVSVSGSTVTVNYSCSQ